MGKRTKSIKIRVTENEISDLRARSTKPKLAEWMRELCLDQEPRKEIPKADPELIRHLGMIGNNLNQIARKLNSYKPVHQAEILAELKSLSLEMERLSR